MTKSTYKPHLHWQELRAKPLKASATQFEAFAGGDDPLVACARKWWFDAVRKLPRPPVKASFAFGTVLHAVVERYLQADDLGRGANFETVNLYPKGWHIARNRYTGESEGEVTPDEQDRIKRMIAEAIKHGVLERMPGRQVEREFTLDIGDSGMSITGFIDLCYPLEVQDHKTSKSTRYFKSANALRKNTQMLIYAKVQLEEYRERHQADPESITLRHNQYCTDPENPVVRKTVVEVTPKEIDKEWDRLCQCAEAMQAIRETVNSWQEIPDPINPDRACNAYGGCQYADICYGRESVEGYIKCIEGLQGQPQQAVVPVQVTVSAKENFTPRSTHMSTFQQRLKNLVGGGSPVVAPPAKAPAQAPATTNNGTPAATQTAVPRVALNPPQTAPAATAPAAPAKTAPSTKAPYKGDPPPWAHPACMACGGSNHQGFSSNGSPCVICDTRQQREGGVISSMFVIEPVGDGTFAWAPREGVELPSGSSPTPSAEAEVKVQERSVAPASAPQMTEAAAQPTPAERFDEATQRQVEEGKSHGQINREAGESAEESFKEQDDEGTDELPPAPSDETVKEDPIATRRGRPRRGFILCVNCHPSKGIEKWGTGRGVHSLTLVLEQLGKKMVEDKIAQKPELAGQLTHWSQINNFERRDWLRSVGEFVTKKFGTDLVIASGVSNAESDIKALFDAVRPYAGMEIHPDGLV